MNATPDAPDALDPADGTDTPDAPDPPSRATVLRDVAVLQVKLIVDGFRDLLLVPASLVAGAIGLLRGDGGADFYKLLRLGRDSERWINLFGALDREADGSAPGDGDDIERLVTRVESFVVDEYRHGHLSGQAREQIEGAVDKLRRAARRHAQPPPEE